MILTFIGAIRFTTTLSARRLVSATLAAAGAAFALVGVAGLSKSGLNPHGVGILVALPVAEGLLLSSIFGLGALARALFPRDE